MSVLRPTLAAAKMLLVLTVILGVIYPAVITVLGGLSPARADGSLLLVDGRPAGSHLLGQLVTDPGFFQGRPSASQASGTTSGGTNLGPGDPRLAAVVAEREAALRHANPEAGGPIPPDALTSSGSGLDPDISPGYAAWQIPRVAAATGLSRAELQALVDEHTCTPLLGFIGNPRVNVTELNAALAERRDR